MSFYESPHTTWQQAYKAAQASCLRERSRTCEAYGGVNCDECPKRDEGIKRRIKRTEEKNNETVAHHGIINGPSVRMRKRNDGKYWHLEIGEWVGKPPFFRVEKSLLVERELVPLITPLYEVALKDIECETKKF